MQPIGSAVTLNCTVHVELSPAVDVPVTVNTVWTGPAGFMTTIKVPVIDGTTTYTSTAMIISLGRNQSGVYTCTATLHSMVTMTYSNATVDSYRVTTGEITLISREFH